MEVKEYAPGAFCWMDLGTTDAVGAKAFYGELLGWSYLDVPAGPDSNYALIQMEGKDIGGLYLQNTEQQSQGIPPNWLSYVSVANVEESIQNAKSFGGTLRMGPHDVFDKGRMAILADPFGSSFAIWQPLKHIGASLTDLAGTLCWNELATTDTVKSGEFYSKLFHWGKQVQQMGTTQYTIFVNGDRPAGGMYQLTPEMGNFPAHWLVYFAVEDCDKSVDRAGKMRATVMVPPTDIPETGRFSILRDPQDAAFAIIKLDNL